MGVGAGRGRVLVFIFKERKGTDTCRLISHNNGTLQRNQRQFKVLQALLGLSVSCLDHRRWFSSAILKEHKKGFCRIAVHPIWIYRRITTGSHKYWATGDWNNHNLETKSCSCNYCRHLNEQSPSVHHLTFTEDTCDCCSFWGHFLHQLNLLDQE